MTIEKRLLFSHVERDWTIMFSTFIVLLLLMSALNIYFFISFDRKNLVVEKTTTSQVETFDKKELRRSVEFFEQKEKEFKELKKEGISTPDPAE